MCQNGGWSLWWPAWSKRPVLYPPKGKGKPLCLKVIRDIPYVMEPNLDSAVGVPAAFGPVTDGGLRSPTSVESKSESPCESKDIGGSVLGTLCSPCAPADAPVVVEASDADPTCENRRVG